MTDRKRTFEEKQEALEFLHEYAKNFWRFDGGDVLEAWRSSGSKVSRLYWRNSWALLMKEGERLGWYIKVDLSVPKAKQSHTRSLTLWQSRLCSPDSVYQDVVSYFINKQVSLLRLGKIDATELAWRAYSFAFEKRADENKEGSRR